MNEASGSRIVVALAAAFLAACVRSGPLSPDEKTAARQITVLLPKGTSESRALRTLVDHGFSLSRLSSDAAANHLLVGSQLKGTTFWQVGIVIVDAKVESTTVKVTDVGPGSK
jgi:hypothetical protein